MGTVYDSLIAFLINTRVLYLEALVLSVGICFVYCLTDSVDTVCVFYDICKGFSTVSSVL